MNNNSDFNGRPLNYRNLQQKNAANFTEDEHPFKSVKFYNPVRPIDLVYEGPEHSALQKQGQGHYWGESMWDSDTMTPEEYKDQLGAIQDARGKNQWTIAKWGSALGNAAVLAGTTFLDGTVGLLYGLGKAAFDTHEWNTIWNNEVSNGLQEVNEIMQNDVLPYYKTRESEEKPWYEQLGSVDFWADGFLKNMGFTVGALYGGGVFTGGLKALGLLKKAGTLGAQLAGGIFSAVNEGRIEANQNASDMVKNGTQLLQDSRDEAVYNIMNNEDLSPSQKQEAVAQINNNFNNEVVRLGEQAKLAGNMDLILNIPLLAADNVLTFGKFFTKGFDTAKKNLSKNVRNEADRAYLESLNPFRKGVKKLEDAGKYTWENISNKTAIRQGLQDALREGNEELAQAFAAELSTNYFSDTPDSYYKAISDPNAKRESLNFMDSASKAFTDTYGNLDRYQEFALGALTGFLGSPTFGSNQNADANTYLGRGKAIGMSGGIFGRMAEAKETNRRGQEKVNWMNKLQDKVDKGSKNIMMRKAFSDAMDGWAEADNKFEYKNQEDNDIWRIIDSYLSTGRKQDLLDMTMFDVDNMSNEELDNIAKLTSPQDFGLRDRNSAKDTSGWRDSNGDYLSATDAGLAEMRDSLKKKQQEFKRDINNYEDSLNTVRSISNNDSNQTEDEINELAWLLWKTKKFENRAESLKDDNKKNFFVLDSALASYENELNNTLENGSINAKWKGDPIIEDYVTAKTEQNKANIKNNLDYIKILRNILGSIGNMSDKDVAANAGFFEQVAPYLEEVANNDVLYNNLIAPTGMTLSEFQRTLKDISDIGKMSTAKRTFLDRFNEYTKDPNKQKENRRRIDEQHQKKEAARERVEADNRALQRTKEDIRRMSPEERNAERERLKKSDSATAKKLIDELDEADEAENTLKKYRDAIDRITQDEKSDVSEETLEAVSRVLDKVEEGGPSKKDIESAEAMLLHANASFEGSTEDLSEEALAFLNGVIDGVSRQEKNGVKVPTPDGKKEGKPEETDKDKSTTGGTTKKEKEDNTEGKTGKGEKPSTPSKSTRTKKTSKTTLAEKKKTSKKAVSGKKSTTGHDPVDSGETTDERKKELAKKKESDVKKEAEKQKEKEIKDNAVKVIKLIWNRSFPDAPENIEEAMKNTGAIVDKMYEIITKDGLTDIDAIDEVLQEYNASINAAFTLYGEAGAKLPLRAGISYMLNALGKPVTLEEEKREDEDSDRSAALEKDPDDAAEKRTTDTAGESTSTKTITGIWKPATLEYTKDGKRVLDTPWYETEAAKNYAKLSKANKFIFTASRVMYRYLKDNNVFNNAKRIKQGDKVYFIVDPELNKQLQKETGNKNAFAILMSADPEGNTIIGDLPLPGYPSYEANPFTQSFYDKTIKDYNEWAKEDHPAGTKFKSESTSKITEAIPGGLMYADKSLPREERDTTLNELFNVEQLDGAQKYEIAVVDSENALSLGKKEDAANHIRGTKKEELSPGQRYLYIRTSRNDEAFIVPLYTGKYTKEVANTKFGEYMKGVILKSLAGKDIKDNATQIALKGALQNIFGHAFHVNVTSGGKLTIKRSAIVDKKNKKDKLITVASIDASMATNDLIDAILTSIQNEGTTVVRINVNNINSTVDINGKTYSYNNLVGTFAKTDLKKPNLVNAWFTTAPIGEDGKAITVKSDTEKPDTTTEGDTSGMNVVTYKGTDYYVDTTDTIYDKDKKALKINKNDKLIILAKNEISVANRTEEGFVGSKVYRLNSGALYSERDGEEEVIVAKTKIEKLLKELEDEKARRSKEAAEKARIKAEEEARKKQEEENKKKEEERKKNNDEETDEDSINKRINKAAELVSDTELGRKDVIDVGEESKEDLSKYTKRIPVYDSGEVDNGAAIIIDSHLKHPILGRTGAYATLAANGNEGRIVGFTPEALAITRRTDDSGFVPLYVSIYNDAYVTEEGSVPVIKAKHIKVYRPGKARLKTENGNTYWYVYEPAVIGITKGDPEVLDNIKFDGKLYKNSQNKWKYTSAEQDISGRRKYIIDDKIQDSFYITSTYTFGGRSSTQTTHKTSWSAKAIYVEDQPDGWGEENGVKYYKKTIDNYTITIWLPPVLAEKFNVSWLAQNLAGMTGEEMNEHFFNFIADQLRHNDLNLSDIFNARSNNKKEDTGAVTEEKKETPSTSDTSTSEPVETPAKTEYPEEFEDDEEVYDLLTQEQRDDFKELYGRNKTRFVNDLIRGVRKKTTEKEKLEAIKAVFASKRKAVLREKDREVYKPINIQRESAWLSKVLPQLSRDGRVRVVKGLIKASKSGHAVEAFGEFRNGVIAISDKAAVGTMYHEAFHAVTRLMLDNNERQELFSAGALKYGIDPFDADADMEIEEKLAEDFRKYVQWGKIPVLGKAVRFFRTLKHIVQNLVGKEAYITGLFYKIDNGLMRERKINDSKKEALSNAQIEATDLFMNEILGRELSEEQVRDINDQLQEISSGIGDANWHLAKGQYGNWYVAGYNEQSVTAEDYNSPNLSITKDTDTEPIDFSRSVRDYYVRKYAYENLPERQREFLEDMGIPEKDYDMLTLLEKQGLFRCME